MASTAFIPAIYLLTTRMTLSPWHLSLTHPHLGEPTSRLALGLGGLGLGLRYEPCKITFCAISQCHDVPIDVLVLRRLYYEVFG
jgi:hypothetical protein